MQMQPCNNGRLRLIWMAALRKCQQSQREKGINVWKEERRRRTTRVQESSAAVLPVLHVEGAPFSSRLGNELSLVSTKAMVTALPSENSGQ